MSNYSTQGSISVKRLRNGDHLFITLKTNGKPLYQGVDPDSGVPSPDWTTPSNQVEITPEVTSSLGNSVSLTGHTWLHDGRQLVFSGDESGGYVTESQGKFALNVKTGGLKIIGNLASKDNVGNDTLTYKGTATVAAVEYSVTKDIDVVIQAAGANAYRGLVYVSSEDGSNILTSERTTVSLATQLWLGSNKVDTYYIRWYKDNEEVAEWRNNKTITVGMGDVHGSQIFIAEFYYKDGDDNYVSHAAIYVYDSKDEYKINFSITSENKDVDTGKDVVVVAGVYNVSTGVAVDLSNGNPVWRIDVMDGDEWKVLRSVDSNTVTITTADTDVVNEDGILTRLRDVEIIAEVSWI